MSTGIPVVASRVPHFHDLEGICPRITTPEELAGTLDQLFQDRAAYAAQIKKQNAFLIENSWDAIAKRYLSLNYFKLVVTVLPEEPNDNDTHTVSFGSVRNRGAGS